MLTPMLARSIAMTDAHTYIGSRDWHAQIKADGHRMLIHVHEGNITVLGRDGQNKTANLPAPVLADLATFNMGEWMFDGELIGSDLHLFDLPIADIHIGPQDPFAQRYHALKVLFHDVWKPTAVQLMPTATTKKDKQDLLDRALAEHREGIILRHRQGVYKGGRSSHLLKLKFSREVDAIISRVGIDGKDNVELALLDPDGDRVVVVGQASAIGKRPKPEPLQVWETRFLYVTDRENPRLVQPRLVRLRTDKEMAECLFEQLDTAWTDKVLT